jgi:DNA polymerase-3 subunit delta'
VGQPLVARFLAATVAAQTISHAYLFAGPLGAGKTEAASMLARAILCEGHTGADGCDACLRVQHGTHPDFHVVDPEGAGGYLAAQVKELIHDTSLAPVRGRAKVYLITRADLLNGAAANAFLKTLEEPPAGVTFILLARTRDAVLATIRSRCQVVAFGRVPEGEAVRLLCEKAAISEEAARIALAATGGSVLRAADFAVSESRRGVRLKVLEVLERLASSDALDVLDAVRELCKLLELPLDAVQARQAEELERSRDYLGHGALTALEQRQKRELTSRKRDTAIEALNIMRSWLRDALLTRLGQGNRIVNVDHYYNITKTAEAATEPALVHSLQAIDEAQTRLQSNAMRELTLEALLLTIRRELRGKA